MVFVLCLTLLAMAKRYPKFTLSSFQLGEGGGGVYTI